MVKGIQYEDKSEESSYYLLCFAFTLFRLQYDRSKCIHRGKKKGQCYYYENANGTIRKSAGFVNHGGNLYYVYNGGRIATNITLTVGSSKYHAARNGVIHRGVHQWCGRYFYSNTRTGQICTKANFVYWNGRRYYIQKGGIIATNITLNKGNKQYRAYKTGAFAIGVYKWQGKYYYSDPKTGEWIKRQGFVKWNNNQYYIQSNGTVIANQPFVVNNKPYDAAPDGKCTSLPINNPVNSSVLGIAQKEVGTPTGIIYWRWYFGTRFIDTDRTPWCGTFVAWCYNKAGLYHLISDAGNTAYVPCYSRFANRRGKWIARSRARGGDIMVFGRDRHVGIVEKVYKGHVFTIEGNSGPTAAYGSGKPGAVTRKVYKLTDSDIKGVIRTVGN